MSDETTLLPCPFCGGEAEIHQDDNGKWHVDTLRCGNGDISHHAYVIADTEAEAIEAWNTRHERTCLRGWRRGRLREEDEPGVP